MRRALLALLPLLAGCPTPEFSYPPGPPIVESFSASPLRLAAGEEVTVEWRVTNADRVEIDGVIVDLEGTTTRTATATGVVELRAVGPGGERRAVAGYEVEQLFEVRIVSLEADPLLVRPTEPVVVSWRVENASRVRLRNSEGELLHEGLEARGGVRVRPERSTEITLTAEGYMGPATASVFVSAEGGLPFISSFEADPTVATSDQPTLLTWELTGANTLKLFERLPDDTLVELLAKQATNQRDAHLIASVPGTRRFVLEATNEAGSVRAETAAVVVAERRPQILSFTVTPTIAGYGQTVLASWSVRDARQVWVEVNGANRTGNVALFGSEIFGIGSPTTFEVVARDDFGEEARRRISIVFAPLLPAIELFNVSPGIVARGDPIDIAIVTSQTSTAVLMTEDGERIPIRPNAFTWTPSRTTLLELTATSSAGTTTALRRVSVDEPPVITSFSTRGPQLRRQKNQIVRWTAENAISAELRIGGQFTAVDREGGVSSRRITGGSNVLTQLTLRGIGGLTATATASAEILPQVRGSVSEVEPNDTFAVAHDVSADNSDIVDGIIQPGDVDSFYVDFPLNTRLQLATTPSGVPCLGVRVRVFEEGLYGEAVGPRIVAGGPSSCPMLDATNTPELADISGRALVAIDLPLGSSISAYRFAPTTVGRACPDGVVDFNETCDDNNLINGDGCSSICQDELVDEMEPNDFDFDATPMMFGTTVEGALAPVDFDWWSVTLGTAEAGPVRIAIEPGPMGCDLDVEIELFDEFSFIERATGGCATLYGPQTVLAPGTYRIAVSAGPGTTLPIRGRYRLSVTR